MTDDNGVVISLQALSRRHCWSGRRSLIIHSTTAESKRTSGKKESWINFLISSRSPPLRNLFQHVDMFVLPRLFALVSASALPLLRVGTKGVRILLTRSKIWFMIMLMFIHWKVLLRDSELSWTNGETTMTTTTMCNVHPLEMTTKTRHISFVARTIQCVRWLSRNMKCIWSCHTDVVVAAGELFSDAFWDSMNSGDSSNCMSIRFNYIS